MTSDELQKLTVTGAELASVLSLTDRRIRDLASDYTIKAGTDGKFPLVQSVVRYIKLLRARTEKPTITKALRRKLEAEARLAELAVEREEGRYVSVKETELRLGSMCVAMRQVILHSDLSYEEQGEVFEALTKCLDDALCGPAPDDQPDTDETHATTDRA